MTPTAQTDSPSIARDCHASNSAARRREPTESVGQIALDFDAHRAARSSDPETSHAAARNAEKFAASHAGRILAALKAHGPKTAHELQPLVGLSVVQIDRRLPDLRASMVARVVQQDGRDLARGGFRVWEAV